MIPRISSQLYRISLAGLISTISLGGFVPNTYAQPTELRLLQESHFDAPPTDEGSVGGSNIGGKRSDDQCPSAAIMPENHYSSTVTNHPTFWVYVKPQLKEGKQQLAVQANLYLAPLNSTDKAASSAVIDPNTTLSTEDLMHDDFPLILTIEDTLSKDGLISLEVPQYNQGLLPNQLYRWKIKVTCGDSYKAIAAKGESIAEEYGMIRLVKNDVTSNSVQDFSQQGVWVDTIDALARLANNSSDTIIPDTNTEALLKEWRTLLLNLDTRLSKQSSVNP